MENKNVEELREYLDFQENCKRLRSQERAEMQGALLAIGVLVSVIVLGCVIGG